MAELCAKDKDLELMAQEMRLRAERKFGELSLQLEKAQGERTDRTSSNTGKSSKRQKGKVLAALGVTQAHANRCEKLAAQHMDEEKFEEKAQPGFFSGKIWTSATGVFSRKSP